MKISQEMIPLNQDSSSLVDEVNTLRHELGTLVIDVREFAQKLINTGMVTMSRIEIGELLLEIVGDD